MTQAATQGTDVLASAREQVLERGEGLSQAQVLEVLQPPDDRLEEPRPGPRGPYALVRARGRGRGIISLKTGGCPEDCHFCSQSGLFSSPVRSAWLTSPAWSRPPNRPPRPVPPSSASWPPSADPMSG